MTPHEYYCMSPLEFYLASKGYLDKYWKQWDMVRHIMWTTASTIPSKKRMPNIKKFLPLPIDKVGGIESDKAKEMFNILKENLKSGQHGKK